jgi:multidrug transporter EmrE-like cation transporter
MGKEKLKSHGTGILKERKKKNITVLWILFLIGVIVCYSFLNSFNNTKEIKITYVILAGAVIGGVIEMIVKIILINKEIKIRSISTSDNLGENSNSV